MWIYFCHLGTRAFTSRAYPGRQQGLCFQARGGNNTHSWDLPLLTAWALVSLFKPCLSNLPPELLTGLCSEAFEITLFISLSSSDLQCRAFWCRNEAEKIQTASRQHVSRATKKEIGLAHLKTTGLGFDFFDPAESYLCVRACFISVFV